jgi:hypothetical protein
MRTAHSFLAATLVALSGCAAIERQEAADKEKLLAAAGFHMRLADNPERQQDLASMPPRKVVANRKDGKIVYTYADPQNCRCLYVGGPKEYGEYRRLQVNEEIAEYRAEASMDWGAWGPWGPGW